MPAPVLVVLPDPDARADVTWPVLGRPPLHRVAEAAERAGFAGCLLAPGTAAIPPSARPIATGDPIDRPALIVFEGTFLPERMLQLMVEHPLEPDERFTLYDTCGRPTACFVGMLAAVPSIMPFGEELPWPEGFGPEDVARIVYDEDRARTEALVLRSEVAGTTGAHASEWERRVDFPMLRLLANSRPSLPQLELLAIFSVLGSLPLALLGGALPVWLGAAALLLGVQMSRLFPRVHALRGSFASVAPDRQERDDGPQGADRLAEATRPLGHAAFMGGLTYTIVARTDRSGVAAMVLLVAGSAVVLLSLVRARMVLRGRPADVFALPNAHVVARRLGVRWPSLLDGAPVVELVAWLAAFVGVAELPWSVLTAAAIARLWRWFSGPDDLFPRAGRSDVGVAFDGR